MVLPEPALSIPPRPSRLSSVLVAPDYQDTPHVLVTATETTRAGRQLNVTRYRDVANRLGEGVTLLSVPIPPDREAHVAVDDRGYLHLAMPSADPSMADGGQLLRATPEGTIPWDRDQRSLQISSGPGSPVALALDSGLAMAWIADSDAGPGQVIGVRTDAAADRPGGVVLLGSEWTRGFRRSASRGPPAGRDRSWHWPISRATSGLRTRMRPSATPQDRSASAAAGRWHCKTWNRRGKRGAIRRRASDAGRPAAIDSSQDYGATHRKGRLKSGATADFPCGGRLIRARSRALSICLALARRMLCHWE